MPTSVYHYDPLGPPPAFPGAPEPSGHAPHSPALGTVPHSMTSYYSHPAFLPHAARDLREAQAGMQVNTRGILRMIYVDR